jgi:hypothetical protein
MNVNKDSEEFTEVKPWDSLTEEEKASGDWILLPDTTSARRKSELEKVFPSKAVDDGHEDRSLRKLMGLQR